MAVPKNYNQLEKRAESLNDLTFYTVNYEHKFTESYLNRGVVNEDLDSLQELINGTKEFFALTEESAKSKINEWLESLVKQHIIESFKVIKISSQSFYETLIDKKLDKIIYLQNTKGI